MELRQLSHFVAVAEERHFTRAARRLHIAQSGLSASIRSLERELGAELFIRSTRNVDLTDAGRALLVEARLTLGGAAAAKEAVAAVRGVLAGRLVVGTMQCLSGVNVPALMARFHHAHPGVEIHLKQWGSAKLIEHVRSGDVDVAFVAIPVQPAVGVRFTPLATENLMLACGPNHPLAASDGVCLRDVKDETFVDFSSGWLTRDLTDQMMNDAAISRRVPFEVNDVHFLLELVGAGLGVALVPGGFSRKRTSAKFVPLLDPVVEWRTAIATAADRRPSAAAQAFLAGLANPQDRAGEPHAAELAKPT